MIILKVTKNLGLTLSKEDTLFEKPLWVKLTSSAVLGLKQVSKTANIKEAVQQLCCYGKCIVYLRSSWKFFKSYKMFGKSQAKILLRYYDFTRLFNQLIAFTSLHTVSHFFHLKSPKISSFFWIFLMLCRNFSLTKTIDSSSFLLKTTGTSHCS